ncbi:glycerate kinase [Arthrospira sp. O9.13F]|nr:glycerate kinase [Arthrospira sp. O9.13F]
MIEILQSLATGSEPPPEHWQQLLRHELNNPAHMAAFGITHEQLETTIKQRYKLGRSLLKHNPDLPILWEQLPTLWEFWLPLAMQLSQLRQILNRPLVQGILGGQGTGKTTTTTVISRILNLLNYQAISISIDDLYKTYADRQRLREQDPRLIWRGPPGTHDIDIGIQLLDQLRNPTPGQKITIPRFDKSLWNGEGDRIEPQQIEAPDIILFEGWFVGCQPVEDQAFNHPPPPIITDSDRQFAREINHQLKEYLPLWERVDRLIVLNPVDYRLSKQWRAQAEQEMKASGKSGMTDTEINQFVEYFWKSLHPELFINPLLTDSDRVHLVVDIQPDHSVGRVYKPVPRLR